MPIYEYECPQCGHIFEEWVRVSTASNTAQCPMCQATASHIISNTAFVLKGGGWYVTEYGNRKADTAGEKHTADTSSAHKTQETSSADKKECAKSDSDSAKADTKSADTKSKSDTDTTNTAKKTTNDTAQSATKNAPVSSTAQSSSKASATTA